MRKYVILSLLFLLVLATLASNPLSNFTTPQQTYLVVGVVTLECFLREGEVTLVLRNSHDRGFLVWGLGVLPSQVLRVDPPQFLRPGNTTYLTLGVFDGLSEVFVFLVDPETNASVILSCVP